MILKVDINRFGLFSNYKWDQNIGTTDKDKFQKVNIIYGRNYSGKTTLSRILRCVENNKLHDKYLNAEFEIINSDNSVTTNANLESPYNIRVYNTDFVRENLKFLYDENGDIEPFTLLGSGNNVLQLRINNIIAELGSVDKEAGSGDGLIFQQHNTKITLKEKQHKLTKLEGDLNGKLTAKANRAIKSTPYFVKQGINYNVSNLIHEIEEIIAAATKFELTEDEKLAHRVIVDEHEKADINELSESKPQLTEIILTVREIVEKHISVANTIQELVNDIVLQDWVNRGRNLHRDKQQKCAFCGNDILDDRWGVIDAHFSKESETLKDLILGKIELLEESKSNIINFLEIKGVKKDRFYAAYHSQFDSIIEQWNIVSETYINNIDLLLSTLNQRNNDIFKPIAFITISDNSDDIVKVIRSLNDLIKEHNTKKTQLETGKNTSRKALRFAEIESFISGIDYKEKVAEIKVEKSIIETDIELLKILSDNINKLEREKEEKEIEQKDEAAAAIKVNELLSRFFGHNGLRLDPESYEQDGIPITKFIIKRGEEKAHNLSEGECSLISFCYFIAKMDDELKSVDNAKLIIYIDDPISSLDNNHIFFMFSLIESVICKDKKYGQLFISTHNLEFLKYIKRLTIPKDSSRSKMVSHYSIIREQNSTLAKSKMVPMPYHLKENITEYTFLFNELCEITQPVRGDKARVYENKYSQFYNLANNMRKFLECYMCYRYPNTENPLGNLDRLFDNNIPELVNRVINEGSHLTWGDRGSLPQDVVEAETVAWLILKAIKDNDLSHFESLCESVGFDKDVVV